MVTSLARPTTVAEFTSSSGQGQLVLDKYVSKARMLGESQVETDWVGLLPKSSLQKQPKVTQSTYSTVSGTILSHTVTGSLQVEVGTSPPKNWTSTDSLFVPLPTAIPYLEDRLPTGDLTGGHTGDPTMLSSGNLLVPVSTTTNLLVPVSTTTPYLEARPPTGGPTVLTPAMP